MHLGVDTELFRPMPETEREPHRLMTTASADAPLKGLSVLLHAIASLRSSYPDIRLTLVGRPNPGGDTEKLIVSLGLEDVVESCKGISHEEMVQKYASASVAVVPSIYEGFGLPAVEAMACGVPLVSRMEVLSLKWSRMPVWSFQRVIATHLRRRFANCLRMTSFETTTPLAAYRERSTILLESLW